VDVDRFVYQLSALKEQLDTTESLLKQGGAG
jgi:hypothetical protein